MRLDSRIASGYFIGYPENPKGIGFTVQTIVLELLKRVMPNLLRMVKLVRVLTNKLDINEIRVNVSLPIKISTSTVVPNVVP